MGAEPAGMSANSGFMASSAKAIEYGWKTIWNMEVSESATRFDGSLAPVKFNEELFARKVHVGFYTSYGIFDAVPGIERAVLEAKKILEQNDYKVVPIQPPCMREVWRLFMGIVLADINTLIDFLEWDIYSTAVTGITHVPFLLKIPRFFRKFVLDSFMTCLTRMPAIDVIFTKTRQLYFGLMDKEAIARSYFEKMDKEGVDMILCPGKIAPALALGQVGSFLPVVLPYISYNVLNMPSGIAPITR